MASQQSAVQRIKVMASSEKCLQLSSTNIKTMVEVIRTCPFVLDVIRNKILNYIVDILEGTSQIGISEIIESVETEKVVMKENQINEIIEHY